MFFSSIFCEPEMQHAGYFLLRNFLTSYIDFIYSLSFIHFYCNSGEYCVKYQLSVFC